MRPIFFIPRLAPDGPDESLTIMQAAHLRMLGANLGARRLLHRYWRFYGEGDADHVAIYLVARGMGFKRDEIERMWYCLREDPMLTADVDHGIHDGTTALVLMVGKHYLRQLLLTRYSREAMLRTPVEPGSLWLITSLPPNLVATKAQARK